MGISSKIKRASQVMHFWNSNSLSGMRYIYEFYLFYLYIILTQDKSSDFNGFFMFDLVYRFYIENITYLKENTTVATVFSKR